jgi:hypothetical protein
VVGVIVFKGLLGITEGLGVIVGLGDGVGVIVLLGDGDEEEGIKTGWGSAGDSGVYVVCVTVATGGGGLL